MDSTILVLKVDCTAIKKKAGLGAPEDLEVPGVAVVVGVGDHDARVAAAAGVRLVR